MPIWSWQGPGDETATRLNLFKFSFLTTPY
jgi:hypothetical protein